MALVRLDPTRELSSLQGEVNRLFNTFFDVPATGGNGGGSAPRRWIPAMDLRETADDFVLEMDLPGMAPDQVEIEVVDNTLSITGERVGSREESGEGWYRRERATGSFMRTLQLPEGIDADAIKARFDHGVLQLNIPKPEQKKPRKVTIAAGDVEGAAS